MQPTLQQRVELAMQTENSVRSIARKAKASNQYVASYLRRKGYKLDGRPNRLSSLT